MLVQATNFVDIDDDWQLTPNHAPTCVKFYIDINHNWCSTTSHIVVVTELTCASTGGEFHLNCLCAVCSRLRILLRQVGKYLDIEKDQW